MNATLAARTGRTMSPPAIALVAAAILGYGYVASLALHPWPGSWLLKAMPALILCALAWTQLDGRERVLMVAAYLGAAAGDVFLDFDRTLYLRHALACFLVTQLGFGLVFARRAPFSWPRFAFVALFVAASLGLLATAWPNLGAMRVPVSVYLGVLLFMAGAAVMVRGNPWLGLGAFTFLAADTMIGINRFIAPFPHSTAWIVATYVTAQLLIGRGMFLPLRARTG